MSFSLDPAVMRARGRAYYTPILWAPDASSEAHTAEWDALRSAFTGARSGDFSALDDIPAAYLGYRDKAARVFAHNLLGDAGTDAHWS